MPAPYDLRPVTTAVAALLPQVHDSDLDGPTPCEGTTVRRMLFHLIGLSTAFRDAARKDLGPTTSTPPDDMETNLPGDWRTVLPDLLVELAEAWDNPDAWDGMTQAGGVDVPGVVGGQIALNEVTVHGWDLARATGQPYALDDTTLQAAYDLMWPPDEQQREGIFGPVVEVPADAPLLDRVMGLSGRDPGWARPR